MENYNLSENLKLLMDFINSSGDEISFQEDQNKEFVEKVSYLCNNFFTVESDIYGTTTYTITATYRNNIRYLYEFLLVCENLLNEKKLIINRYNIDTIKALNDKNIIKYQTLKTSEPMVRFNRGKKIELESEYFNMRYIPNNQGATNVQNFTTDNSVNITNSTVERTKIQINCTVTENDIDDILQAIELLVKDNENVPQDIKNELSNNKGNKNNIKETLSNFAKWIDVTGATAQINVVVPDLVDSAMKIVSQINI